MIKMGGNNEHTGYCREKYGKAWNQVKRDLWRRSLEN